MQNLKPPRVKKTFFIFFTVLFMLAMLELALRLSGYAYLRLEYPLLPVHRNSGEFNILCVGDSFTKGIGAPYGSSYPEQLARLLNGNRNNKVRFNVYKEFYVNSSTLLKYLNRDIEKYKPGLIIIMTGCNDLWNLENCTYCIAEAGNILSRFNIWLSSLNIYKLAKISLLNLAGLSDKTNPSYQLASGFNQEVKFSFKNSLAKNHFDAGNDYFAQGNYDLALTEFKMAEQLEYDNWGVHFRLACIYAQVLGNYDLGKKHALLALNHGNSSIVGYTLVLMPELRSLPDRFKRDSLIAEMKHIIEISYEGKEKTDALQYLKILFSFYAEKTRVERVIGHNVNEIIKIAKQHNIGIVLMQYPTIRLYVREVFARKANLFKIPLVDNYAVFEDKLKNTPSLKRADLFVKDDHCNAAGYKIIAENVYRALIQYNIIQDADAR